ncbi:methionyl-tRNA formyltransferase [Thermodesulfobacteriota bacterium]
MAIVRKLELIRLERDSKHSEVNCTYAIVEDNLDNKYLQIDTYGSSTRKIPGKKSQSIRFSPEAIEQLKEILKQDF